MLLTVYYYVFIGDVYIVCLRYIDMICIDGASHRHLADAPGLRVEESHGAPAHTTETKQNVVIDTSWIRS